MDYGKHLFTEKTKSASKKKQKERAIKNKFRPGTEENVIKLS